MKNFKIRLSEKSTGILKELGRRLSVELRGQQSHPKREKKNRKAGGKR